ncbi:hypothetical protein T458_19780 [Brevibacillus panacihumi W25]|uniref:Uncharacterized protein n=1 Tax=Brevibacillus panacihumi W25 TaxID=1408254 RepID=V6M5J5_9BACL|nr:hypothetical protein T458_19780 [Brevibacillus panacihumi W25]
MRRTPQWQGKQFAVRIDLDDSIIADAVCKHPLCLKDPPVEQLDINMFRFSNNVLAGQDVPFWMKKEAGTKASLSRHRGLFFRDHTAEKGIHVFRWGSVFGDDGDDSLLYLFDNRHEKIEGMQTAAAHRVFYTCIVGPLFTLQ